MNKAGDCADICPTSQTQILHFTVINRGNVLQQPSRNTAYCVSRLGRNNARTVCYNGTVFNLSVTVTNHACNVSPFGNDIDITRYMTIGNLATRIRRTDNRSNHLITDNIYIFYVNSLNGSIFRNTE